MSEPFAYAEPRHVESADECFFYHVMDLPGIGRVGEQWDLRRTVDDYLGRFDFRGKRALDVGAASGFLTFEMEKRGAQVVSFDLGEKADWDIVPYVRPDFDVEAAVAAKRANVRRLTNGYWLAHRVLGSSAKVFYGDIYNLPDGLGTFDVVVLGAVLLHLRDPFRALWSTTRLSRDGVIVVDRTFESDLPSMQFVPKPEALTFVDTWWQISSACIGNMLQVLGFQPPRVSRSLHLAVHQGGPRCESFTTLVAHREMI